MTFTLPELPYAYDALDPYMSAETLEFHHDKHHLAYVDKGNELIAGSGLKAYLLKKPWSPRTRSCKSRPVQPAWSTFQPHSLLELDEKDGGGTAMAGALEQKIAEDIGGYDAFRAKFIEAGMTQFGSGWCWLAMDNATGKLEVVKTPNGENPVVFGKTALLGCDVWEHSYYIDYRNARPKYLEAFVDNMINWDYVAELFEKGPMDIKVAA